MPKISQKNFDAAVNYARQLMKGGLYPSLAFVKAGKYYGEDSKEINKAISKRGGLASAKKRQLNSNYQQH